VCAYYKSWWQSFEDILTLVVFHCVCCCSAALLASTQHGSQINASSVGCQTVSSGKLCFQAWSAKQLQQDLGFAADQAKQLSEWSRGFDASPVAERPPPKTLSIQMTLTPIPLVMHPSMGRDIAVAGGKAGESRLTSCQAHSCSLCRSPCGCTR